MRGDKNPKFRGQVTKPAPKSSYRGDKRLWVTQCHLLVCPLPVPGGPGLRTELLVLLVALGVIVVIIAVIVTFRATRSAKCEFGGVLQGLGVPKIRFPKFLRFGKNSEVIKAKL